MDINENLMLTNSFSKGMNTDVSDAFVQDEQYRIAKNLRYVTNTESNTGELHLIEGVEKSRINIPVNEEIIATASVRNYGIIITNFPSQNKIRIYRFDKNEFDDENENKTVELHLIFGPWARGENVTDWVSEKLDIVSKYEDKDNAKIYISDGKNTLAVVALFPDTVPNGITKVSSIINTPLLPPTVAEELTGNLRAGIVQYGFRLYNKYSVGTNMSPLSVPYPIIKKTTNINTTSGYEQDKRSTVGLKVKIDLSESDYTTFDRMLLYRITYVQNNQSPLIEVIKDSDVTDLVVDGIFTYNDYGSISLQTVSAEEINDVVGIDIRPSVIESKQEWLVAGNVKYNQAKFCDKWDAKENVKIDKTLAKSENPIDDNKDNPYISMGTSWSSKRAEENTYAKRTLRRGETYRYGIVLYGKNGERSDVKHIGDIYIDPKEDIIKVENSGKIKAINKGVKVTVSNLPEEVFGYEIVRCNRTVDDSVNVAQGVLSVTMETPESDKYADIYTLSPAITVHPVQMGAIYPVPTDTSLSYTTNTTGFASQFNLHNINGEHKFRENSNSTTNLLLFISPEISYRNADVENILNTNTCSVEIDKIYSPLHKCYSACFNVFAPYTQSIGKFNVHSKGNIGNRLYFLDNEHYVCGERKYYSQSANHNYFYTYFEGGHESRDANGDVSFNRDILFRYGFDRQKDLSLNGTLNGGSFFYSKYDGIDMTGNHDGKTDFPSASRTGIYTKHIVSNGGNAIDIYDTDVSETKKTLYYQGNNLYSYIKLGPSVDKDSLFESKILASDNIKTTINSFKIANSPSFAHIVNEDDSSSHPVVTAMNDIQAVGDRSYVNWCIAPYLNDAPITGGVKTELINYLDAVTDNEGAGYENHMGSLACPIGPGGKSLIFSCNNLLGALNVYDSNESNYYDTSLFTFLVNITKPTTPYGGQGKESIESSIYYSHGNFVKVDGNSKTYTSEIFDGDTYIQMFEYPHIHKWTSAKDKYGVKFSVIYGIPVETSVNMWYDYGYRFSEAIRGTDNSASWIQLKAGSLALTSDGFNFAQEKPMYQYNSAYSSPINAIQFATIDEDSKEETDADYRLHYSQIKDNNERIDSWSVFKAMNYLDVDSRYGKITNLRLFKDSLIFWQEHAVGVVSLNEKQLLLNEDGTNLLLGTGGVLDRFDYISTTYGMLEDQHCDAQSDTMLYWWDGSKREILALNGQKQLISLSKIKTVQNYINSNKSIVRPNITVDTKYNEILFNVVENGTIVYNEQTQQFTSVYDIPWSYYISFADRLLLTSDSTVYDYNTSSDGLSKGFGDTVLYPYLKYVINKSPQYNKVYDNAEFGGRFYGGDDTSSLSFEFNTPLKQTGKLKGEDIKNKEYSFRFAIPRAGYLENDVWKTSNRGDRLRGKTMLCELTSSNNSTDFSLQYITTKYRMSWS